MENLNSTINNLCLQIWHMNKLLSYPLSDPQIESWAKTINELTPQLTPEQLRFIINGMMLGELDFDPKVGIQNIFKNYKKIVAKKILTSEKSEKKQHELALKNFNLISTSTNKKDYDTQCY